MALSRIVLSVDGSSSSIIPPRWLTRIFVFGDIFSFVIQGTGAGLLTMASMSDGDTNPDLGPNIIIGGLIFQLAVFATFIVTAAIFQVKFRRSQEVKSAVCVPWESSLRMLYVTSGFVMVRNVFRVVEYAMGEDGYLLGTEWPVYVFDAVLMMGTMAWFLWRYPSQLCVQGVRVSSGRGSEIDMMPNRQYEGAGGVA